MPHASSRTARRRLTPRCWAAAPLLISLAGLIVMPSAPGALAQEGQDKPVPKDSERLVVTGCLKGRVLTVARNPTEGGEVLSGRDVVGRSFRLAGPKDLMRQVKEHDGDFVEVTGLVKKNDLEAPSGMRIGNTKVTIGLGAGYDPNRRPTGVDPQQAVSIMDITAFGFITNSCPIERK
jgi:hypothetical protein